MARKRSPLKNKKILLGVTGSVAAYKAVELVRRLKDEEADVRVVMTSASLNFVTPLSLELASNQKPISSLWEEPLAHINLPAGADLFLVAPATANTLSKMALGLADNIVSACFLAYRCKTLVAPAMNPAMYAHPSFGRNLDFLRKELGVVEIPPEEGALACGTVGVGRMAAVEKIVEAAGTALTEKDFQGLRVVVTAGPTREPIDPVRFISNRSSGRMGFALAKAACARGAEVVLISGPGTVPPPQCVKKLIRVETAAQMEKAVLEEVKTARLLVMAAAPADFTPEETLNKKIIKSDKYNLKLKATHDILLKVSSYKKRPFTVGFAAETGPETGRAQEKLKKKDLDMIVFNDVTRPGAGFDCGTNAVTIFTRGGGREDIPLMGKEDVAHAILDSISGLLLTV